MKINFVLIYLPVFISSMLFSQQVGDKRFYLLDSVQIRELVEEKQQEILDLISYAKRIQSAILPSEKLIRSYFPQTFILYQPEDIVAGDFYWFKALDDPLFFAVSVFWAGANNPLWILRGSNLLEYKADKQPIGKFSDAKPPTTHQIKLEKNDEI